MNVLFRILLVTVFFTMTGCVFVPKDLQLISIEEIKSSTIDYEIPPVAESMLRIEFSSRGNVIDYTSNNTNALSADAYFCEQPNQVAFLADYLFFFKRLDKNQDNTLYIYEGYLFVKWTRTSTLSSALRKDEEQEHYLKYDLSTNPKDVCFSIGGGYFSGMGRRSNTVKISKEKIKNALHAK